MPEKKFKLRAVSVDILKDDLLDSAAICVHESWKQAYPDAVDDGSIPLHVWTTIQTLREMADRLG